MKWKIVFVEPAGAAIANAAFEMLFPFPTREAAEAHAACFRFTGMKVEVRSVTPSPRERRLGERE
jgi:hypothetical protein